MQEDPDKQKKIVLFIWMLVGIFLALGPFWGLFSSLISIHKAMTILQTNAHPPQELLDPHIARVVYSTIAGFIMVPIGLFLVILSTMRLSKLKKKEFTIDEEDSQTP